MLQLQKKQTAQLINPEFRTHNDKELELESILEQIKELQTNTRHQLRNTYESD